MLLVSASALRSAATCCLLVGADSTAGLQAYQTNQVGSFLI
jgi:hypothetical protein